jgi:hypothetical protein
VGDIGCCCHCCTAGYGSTIRCSRELKARSGFKFDRERLPRVNEGGATVSGANEMEGDWLGALRYGSRTLSMMNGMRAGLVPYTFFFVSP